jgi:quinoprotein glucose dehydrogenase
VPQRISADDAFGLSFWDRAACREQLASARNDGLFTPPSTQGTLQLPAIAGGVNWGGVAFDPVGQILYANTSRAAFRITLLPRDAADTFKRPLGVTLGQQRGAPFAVARGLLMSPLGLICSPPPWGAMVAVDLKAGKLLWQSRLGTTEDVAPLGIALQVGMPAVNGVLVTHGGLVFSGAMDAYLRALDARSGAELWQGRLPVPGIANPMTYAVNGTQYVAIAAGGHSEVGTSIGDSVVAFRLAADNESPSLWSVYVDRPGGRLRAAAVAIVVVLLLLAVAWSVRRKRSLP